MTQVDPSLQSVNVRPRAINANGGASSTIDMPMEPVSVDHAYNAIVRIEAKVDALLSTITRHESAIVNMKERLDWVVGTVAQFVEGVRSNPMLAKMMGSNRGND